MKQTSNRKAVLEAALALKPKDRESIAQELLKSIWKVDEDLLVEGAKIAHRRIKQSDRDPSRLVSEEEILRILAAEEE